MKSFFAIFPALFWFVLCVVAALLLLTIALIYNGLTWLLRETNIKKLEFPKIQIAK